MSSSLRDAEETLDLAMRNLMDQQVRLMLSVEKAITSLGSFKDAANESCNDIKERTNTLEARKNRLAEAMMLMAESYPELRGTDIGDKIGTFLDKETG
jgi:hypothetical protein